MKNSTEKLKELLDAAGLDYKVDDDGNIVGSPELVSTMRAQGLLRGEEDLRVTKEELESGKASTVDVRTPAEKGYEFLEFDTEEEVKEQIDKGNYLVGMTKMDTTHGDFELYVGPIRELQGKMAFVSRDFKKDPFTVAAQFQEATMVLNERALGFGMHEFPRDHFSDLRHFREQWTELPSKARTEARKPRKIPRLDSKGKFKSRKQNRRGVGGAFGGKKSKVIKPSHKHLNTYLLNIICEDEENNKTISVKAKTLEAAKAVILEKHNRDFPDQTVTNIELHELT